MAFKKKKNKNLRAWKGIGAKAIVVTDYMQEEENSPNYGNS